MLFVHTFARSQTLHVGPDTSVNGVKLLSQSTARFMRVQKATDKAHSAVGR